MTREQLLTARKKSGLTQVRAAARLGVTQGYLSQLEEGMRPLTAEMTKKMVRLFELSPTELPLEQYLWKVRAATDERLAEDLSALKYPGFSHLKHGRPKNPAVVLISALRAPELDARLVEALPWVVWTYHEMDWNKLVTAAKARDLQNRLGFVTNVARRTAELKADKHRVLFLGKKERELEDSRLAKEGTLCHDSMTESEKKWLRKTRPDAARYWNLLADLSPDTIEHYDY